MIWGTGTPKREFLYVGDLADACLCLMDKYESSEIINVGTGKEISIGELAELVAQGEVTEVQIRAFNDIHDRLLMAGLMQ